VLLVGIAIAAAGGGLHLEAVSWSLTTPLLVMPDFSLSAMVSLALPLFLVTMASQNLPGVAAIRAAGYDMPISKIVTLTGGATLLLAPFGGYALNLSAITASICMGRESHPDPDRRYVAAVVCGAIYCLIGLFGAAVTGVLTAFPRELVVAVAGFALLGSIGGGLAVAVRDDTHREAALITFLVTLSGLSIAGIGSAFWGVVAGGVALLVQQWRWKPTEAPPP
jgi:benzoate membrane transport protein